MLTITHDRVADPLPPPPLPPSVAGTIVQVPYAGGSRLGMIASDTDPDGTVAVMLMVENVRAPLDDLEVIPRG
jgi:hypothetical protein